MAVALNCREYGEGPPLILLHGLFGSSRNWHSLARKFAESHHVLAADLRNHGDSPWTERMDYQTMAEDVRQLIQTRHLAKPTVLGHSMGGKAAMVLALCYPELIKRLIIVDIAPVAYTSAFSSYIDAMQCVDLTAVKKRSDADKSLRKLIPGAGIRAFLLQNLVSQAGAWRWRLNLDSIAQNMALLTGFPQVLKTRSCPAPTSFIIGGASNSISEQDHNEIRRLFPQAVFTTIAQAGHWVHADQPGRFFDTVVEFMNDARG